MSDRTTFFINVVQLKLILSGFVGKSKHFSIGLAAFILTLIVALLGLVAHYSKVKTQSGPSIVGPNKSVFHYAHWTIAVVVVGLWYSQIFTGIQLYNQPGRAIPHGLVIGARFRCYVRVN